MQTSAPENLRPLVCVRYEILNTYGVLSRALLEISVQRENELLFDIAYVLEQLSANYINRHKLGDRVGVPSDWENRAYRSGEDLCTLAEKICDISLTHGGILIQQFARSCDAAITSNMDYYRQVLAGLGVRDEQLDSLGFCNGGVMFDRRL